MTKMEKENVVINCDPSNWSLPDGYEPTKPFNAIKEPKVLYSDGQPFAGNFLPLSKRGKPFGLRYDNWNTPRGTWRSHLVGVEPSRGTDNGCFWQAPKPHRLSPFWTLEYARSFSFDKDAMYSHWIPVYRAETRRLLATSFEEIRSFSFEEPVVFDEPSKPAWWSLCSLAKGDAPLSLEAVSIANPYKQRVDQPSVPFISSLPQHRKIRFNEDFGEVVYDVDDGSDFIAGRSYKLALNESIRRLNSAVEKGECIGERFSLIHNRMVAKPYHRELSDEEISCSGGYSLPRYRAGHWLFGDIVETIPLKGKRIYKPPVYVSKTLLRTTGHRRGNLTALQEERLSTALEMQDEIARIHAAISAEFVLLAEYSPLKGRALGKIREALKSYSDILFEERVVDKKGNKKWFVKRTIS